MMDLTEDERLLALSLWVGVVLFTAILYLTGSYWKAILIGLFVLISCLLGFGRRWLLRLRLALRALINGRSCCKTLGEHCSLGSLVNRRDLSTK